MIERASIAALQVQFASAYVLNAEGKPGVKVDVSQAKGINPADIKPLNPGDAERMAASRVAAKGLVPDNVARWGYRAQLMAQGGQASVDSFHANLLAYLKTPPLWPSTPSDAPPGSVIDSTT